MHFRTVSTGAPRVFNTAKFLGHVQGHPPSQKCEKVVGYLPI